MMTGQQYGQPATMERRRRRRLGRRGIALLALSGMVVAGVAGATSPVSTSGRATNIASVAAFADTGAVTFAGTKVDPGSPVPLSLITEDSFKELAGKGLTGKGIDVALVDSGVTPVRGLDQSDKILYGPDLSNEGGLPNLANLDTFGHGTHLAGIIAGDDGDQVGGIAPDSRIVSVKVAGATGETDVAQVIAGIDWVIEHKNDNGLNIRVLNLSLGVAGVSTNQGDPLSIAVERAWAAGIVVVAAAGNRGNEAGGVDSPAVSPYVIAVGATESYDSSGKKDTVPTWSSGGNEYRQPDVVAPGRSIVSFRVPGSVLDQLHPSAVVDGKYFVGSGTSQAAAVVSGFTAAMLSGYPSLTPDQVKYLFEESAKGISNRVKVEGHGRIQPKHAVKDTKDASKAGQQRHAKANRKDDPNEPVSTLGATWSGGTWNGATWSGGQWSGATWSGATWSGATWSGGLWSGATWSGATWSGATWSGATWSGATWSGATWSGATWSGATWSGQIWQ